MKKFLNKLSTSGNLKEETQFSGEEHIDTHVRKQTTLPSDPKPKDAPEDIKIKKSFSLSKATSSRFKEAMESDDFSKKKSSSNGLKKEKIKDTKLNESDDKTLRKSKSMKSPSAMKSPSIKNIFGSPSYEHQKDAKGGMMNYSSDSEEEDAFVPHNHPDLRDENENNNLSFTPIRVPSAPARLATSPSFSSSSLSHSPSPSPTMVSLNNRAVSPPFVSSPSGKKSPPTFNSSSPPSFTKMPPSHALAPTPSSPHVIVADEFDTAFENRNHSDTFVTPIKDVEPSDFRSEASVESRIDDDDDDDDEHVHGEEEVLHQKNKSGLFSFGSNKMKLKA